MLIWILHIALTSVLFAVGVDEFADGGCDQLNKFVMEIESMVVPWNAKEKWVNQFHYPYITDCPNPLEIDTKAHIVEGVWPADKPCPTDSQSLEACWISDRKDFDQRKRMLGADGCALYKEEKDKLFAKDWVTNHKELARGVLDAVEVNILPWQGVPVMKEMYLMGMLGYVIDICYRWEPLYSSDLHWLKKHKDDDTMNKVFAEVVQGSSGCAERLKKSAAICCEQNYDHRYFEFLLTQINGHRA